MRSTSLLAVAVLVVLAFALPIQSAFAASLSLYINPNPVVLGGSIIFSGTADPVAPGAFISLGIWYGTECNGGSPQTGGQGTEDNSGNYQIVFITGKEDLSGAGQYVARTVVTDGPISPCVAFTVLPLITLAPTCGPPETTVQVTGSGFFDASSCTITSSPSGLIGEGGQGICVVDAGGVSGAFVVAAGASGAYDVVVTPNVGQSGSAVFTTPCGFQPILAPVGGVVIPANTLALVAPWLAVIGIVGCISTVFVIRKICHP